LIVVDELAAASQGIEARKEVIVVRSRAAVEYDCRRAASDTPLEEVDSTNRSGASLFGQALSLRRYTDDLYKYSGEDGARVASGGARTTGEDHNSIATASAT
jgi:hypothetical protein